MENVTIGIYYLSNDTKVTEVTTNAFGDARVNQQLEDDDYYYIARNSTNHTIEYGEINIGSHPASIVELCTDWDHDNFDDDFSYTGKYYNVTPIGIVQEHINLTITIYDSVQEKNIFELFIYQKNQEQINNRILELFLENNKSEKN